MDLARSINMASLRDEETVRHLVKMVMSKSNTFVLAMLSLGIVVSVLLACPESTSASPQNSSTKRSSRTQKIGASQATVDKGDLRLRYEPRKNRTAATESHAVGSNPETIQKLIADLNERLKLPFNIDLVFLDCNSPDAFYDPEIHEIHLCYQLIDDYYDLFSITLKDKQKLDEAVKAAMVAAFFHELGHGLVDAWKIPITGREEDAVDQLSTLVLIEATKGGEQMALAGALSFRLYAEVDRGEKKIYWDVHSLDEQRFFDTVCLVYGHDEKKYEYLVENGTLPEERAAACTEDYARITRSWHQLLAPYLKAPARERRKLRLD